MKLLHVLPAAGMVAGLLGPAIAVAQGDSTAAKAERSVMSGVMNSEQVARGRTAHRTQCGNCHGTEAYSGEAFEKAWKGRTVFDFVDLVRSTMPNDNPGSLPAQDYVDVTAYVLNLNGFPQGENELPKDDAELQKIRIDSIPPRAGFAQATWRPGLRAVLAHRAIGGAHAWLRPQARSVMGGRAR